MTNSVTLNNGANRLPLYAAHGIPLKATLQRIEATAIMEAVKEGYLDPHDDDAQRATLFPPAPEGETYRRFIKGFQMVDYSQLTDNNNRFEDVDETHCREILIPRLELAKQINFPIMATAKTPVSFYINHGHNRSWSSNSIWPSRQIPMFELEKDVYKVTVDTNGQEIYTPVQGPAADLGEFLSETRCNPGVQNKPYTMDCIVGHLEKSFKLDPTFLGVNTSGAFPTRSGGTFDAIMDLVSPSDFLYKGTRTKIYNRWKAGAPTTSTIAQTMASRTAELAKAGWDPGLFINDSGVLSEQHRKEFKSFNWFCSGENAYIGKTTSNGNKFKEKIVLALIDAHCSGRIMQSNNINLLYIIDNPSHVLATLETQRDKEVTEVKSANDMFKTLGIPFRFKKIRFVKQLKDSNDKGRTVKL